LPENAFVAAARDTIPEARVRVTTASTRGNLRGRGRGRGASTKEKLKGKAPEEISRGTGRGTGRKRAADATTTASAQPLDATKDRAVHRATTSTRGYNRGLGVLTSCCLVMSNTQVESQI
jgi:hypothetical protein